MKLYRDVLHTGWQDAIMRPGLWVLGLFAIGFFGVAGEIDRYIRFMSSVFAENGLFSLFTLENNSWNTFITGTYSRLAGGDVGAWVFFVTSLVAIVVVLYMIALSQASIVAAIHNKKLQNLQSAMRIGQKHVGQVLCIQLIAYICIAVFGLSARFGIGAIYSASASTLLTLLGIIVAAVLLLLVVLYASYVARYAIIYIVTSERAASVLQAVRKAHRLLMQHLLVTVEMSVVVFAVVGLLNVAVVVSIAVALAPFTALSYSLATLDERVAVFLNAAVAAGLIYTLVLILATMIFSVWQWSAWVELFDRLHKEQPTAKIVRALKGN